MSRRKSAVIRSVEVLHQGFLRVSRYIFDVEKHGGGRQDLTREIMERGDAVAVLGYDPARDEVVLVNEFRPGAMLAGVYPYTDNLVAGAIDAGESPLDAAVREMQEEAGLELRNPQVIHPGAFVSTGGTSERIVIVAGSVDSTRAGGVHGNPHEQEDILVVVRPAAEVIEQAHRAEIADLKTLVALFWLERYRHGQAQDLGELCNVY